MLRLFPILFAIALLVFIALHPHAEFDSRLLILGHLNPQKFRELFPQQGTDWFPLFQHITCQIFYWLGARTDYALCRAWSTCSFISLLAIAGLAFYTVNKSSGRAAALTSLLIIFTGPILYYGNSSYNEVPAGFLTLAYASALLLNAPIGLTAILFVLTAITKEIAFPILMLLWLIRLQGKSKPQIVRELPAIFISAAVSFSLASYFNYTRYHSIWNLEYLKPFRTVHSPLQQALFFLAEFFSPSGGLLFYWPLFFFLLIIAFRHLTWRILITVTALLLVMIGLARWHDPFGWVAWGPRLIIPWIPAITAMLLSNRELAQSITRLLTRNTLLLTLLICLFLLPQIIAIDEMPFMYSQFVPAQLPEESPRYIHQLNMLMWNVTPMPIIALKHFLTFPHVVLAILSLPAVYCLLQRIRRESATINETNSASSASPR